jgi:HK97 family phage major capsid protein
MPSNLKRLQDRAAAIAARMSDLAAAEERSEEQTTELRRLSDEADKVKADLEFESTLAAKEAELRAVVEKAAPAPVAAPVEERKVEIRPLLPNYRSLRAFNDGPEAVESAYRCGRWLRATVFRNADDLRWCRDHGVEARAMNEASNSAGGALVPEEFANRVIRLVEEFGTFPPAAENVTMTRDTMIIPKRITGTTAYFTGEGSAIDESQPTYSQVNLVAKKLAVSCRMSTEVVEDALVSLADAVATEFATSLAYKVDLCGWLGEQDNTGVYGGIHGIVPKIDRPDHTASVVTAEALNTSFESLDIEDFLKAVGKLPLYARAGAAWYISPAGFAASISRLKYAGGGNTVENIGGAAGETFLGYPVRLVHVMNSVLGVDSGKVKVLFGNLGLSSIYARRRDFSVRLYDQVYAVNDQLLLQGTMRFDINHHSLGTATEPGPVIALKTA